MFLKVYIDINKTNDSGERIFGYMSYFFSMNCRFQTNVRDGFHTLLQKATTFKEVTMISIKRRLL